MDGRLVRCPHPSPLGKLTLVASERALVAVLWPGERSGRVPVPAGLADDPGHPVLAAARVQLDEYLAGVRRVFELPLELRGTPFQQLAWRALATVPYGTTVTYAEQAARLGRPRAARAVGAANGRNPLSIVLPCHRVVGAGGSLTGFAGGLAAKRALLDLEARAAA